MRTEAVTLRPRSTAPDAAPVGRDRGLQKAVFWRDRDGSVLVTPGHTAVEAAEWLGHPEAHKSKRKVREYFEDSEWDCIGDRGVTAKLLFEAGLKAKAHRYADCFRKGFPLDCSNPHCCGKFFDHYYCGARFCQTCAPKLHAQLFARYSECLMPFVNSQPFRPNYTLARINFTVRSSGKMPTPNQIRDFNSAIRRVLKRVVGMDEEGRPRYGIFWVDEFGFELRGRRASRKAGGKNLHAHGLYYGPYVIWKRLRDAWLKETGSTGVWLTEIKRWPESPDRAVRRALGHMLKYVSKVPAVTPERVAAFEIAFHRVRRVHAGGLFYALRPPDDDLHQLRPEDPGRHCPDCGSQFYIRSRPWEVFPVEALRAEHRRNLEEALREAGRKKVFGGRGP